jgi:1-acyl-sn-glycerol-3-phosphate acyltransferase
MALTECRRMKANNPVAWLRLLLLVLWIAACYPVVYLSGRLQKLALRDQLLRIAYAGVAWLIGLRVRTEGELASQRPLLVVSNHLSYTDVFVAGSVHPFGFTPKAEVAGWPIISAICRVCGCIFITRKASHVAQAVDEMRVALQQGRVLCLYPEGTTGDGVHMQPFKSSMFALAAQMPDTLYIQPMVVHYRAIRRMPIGRDQWPSIAWYGDMELAPHLMELLSLGRVDVVVRFLEAVPVSRFADRKALAAHCEQAIRASLEQNR